jgi:hypothetical protein
MLVRVPHARLARQGLTRRQRWLNLADVAMQESGVGRIERQSPALYGGAGPSRRTPRTLSTVVPSAGNSTTHQVAPAAP